MLGMNILLCHKTSDNVKEVVDKYLRNVCINKEVVVLYRITVY